MRFRRQVTPGDQLIITAELIRRKGNMGKVAVVARVGDEVAVEGEFMFALVGGPARNRATARQGRRSWPYTPLPWWTPGLSSG